MSTQIELLQERFRKLHQMRVHRLCDKKRCCHVLEGLFWGISKIRGLCMPKKGEQEQRRLERLLVRIRDNDQQPDQLQRDVMEISELAQSGDKFVVDALSTLINHKSRYVRASVCKTLARIGGEEAEQILEGSLESDDVDIKEPAVEALSFYNASSLVEEFWVVDVDKYIESVRIDPYSNPNRINCEAYRKQHNSLVAQYHGQFAAYHNGERIAIAPNEEQAYTIARKKVPRGLVMIQPIIREEERRVVKFRSPRIRKG